MSTHSIESAIREAFPMPEDVRRHASAANCDLYFGPLKRDHWRSEDADDTLPDYEYCQSRDIFADWLESLALPAYIELDSDFIMSREPEGEWLNDDFEPCGPDDDGAFFSEPGPYAEITRRDVADAYGYAELFKSC